MREPDTSRFRALLQDFVQASPIAIKARSASGVSLGRPLHRWIELGAILLCGNLANALSWRLRYPINTGPFAILLALALYAYVGYAYLRRGLQPCPVRHSMSWRRRSQYMAIAVGAGLALGAPSLLFLLVSSAHGSFTYSPIQTLSVGALLFRLLVEIPLLTAIVEEFVFRQYLYRRFEAAAPVKTVFVNAGIFVLWHLAVTLRTVADTNYAQHPVILIAAYLGALAAIFIGGAVFAMVRQRTGSFAYSAITHWLAVALLTLGARVF